MGAHVGLDFYDLLIEGLCPYPGGISRAQRGVRSCATLIATGRKRTRASSLATPPCAAESPISAFGGLFGHVAVMRLPLT
jgi:hypothetical protein